MDSWTPTQLAIMKAGGNMKCAAYLSSNGINPTVSIQQKYDTIPARLYKEVLKARAEGRPEPTSLPPPKTKRPSPPPQPSAGNNANKVEDQKGMERLNNESEADYVKRQLRLREEAKARMAAKFGNSGNRSMGGVGSRPAPSAYEAPFSMEDGAGFGLWSSISQSAQSVAEQLANTDALGSSDGGAFQALNQKFKGQKESSTRSYSGFGSEDMQFKNSGAKVSTHDSVASNGAAAADEDQNSIAPLTGETDKQYMERQIRIREE